MLTNSKMKKLYSKGANKKLLILGLGLIIIFLVALYLGPLEGLEKYGLISQKKGEELPAEASSNLSGENLMFVTFADGRPAEKINPGTVRVAVKNIGRVVVPAGYSLAPGGEGMLGMLYLRQNQSGYDGTIDKGYSNPKIYPWTTGIVIDDRPKTSPYDNRYHWHFNETTIGFAEITMEACQAGGGFSFIEKGLDNLMPDGRVCMINHIVNIENIILKGAVTKAGIVLEGTPYRLTTPDGRIFYLSGDAKVLGGLVGKTVRVSGIPKASLNYKNILVEVQRSSS